MGKNIDAGAKVSLKVFAPLLYQGQFSWKVDGLHRNFLKEFFDIPSYNQAHLYSVLQPRRQKISPNKRIGFPDYLPSKDTLVDFSLPACFITQYAPK